MMTGLSVTNHGVKVNKSPLTKTTIFEQFKLNKPQIKTGIIGKYLNSYNGERRPEFDLWNVYSGVMISNWFQFKTNLDGNWKIIKQYVSDYYIDQARAFTDQYKDQPYLLYLHFTAPHFPAQVPASFNFNCDKVRLSHFNQIDMQAPIRYRQLPELSRAKLLARACKRAASMSYLDMILAPYIQELDQQGMKVIIVSDNGYMLGDFRQTKKTYLMSKSSVLSSLLSTFPSTRVA